MAGNNILQNLNKIMRGNSVPEVLLNKPTSFNAAPEVVFSTNNQEEYDAKMMQLRQQKLLSAQWVKAGADNAMANLQGQTATKLMYRDCDLMETCPEIAAALDIYENEACNLTSKGKLLNIYSKSPRVKAILEDLFVNRLKINTTLPMICRDMCKYGNEYQLLNINLEEGIMGWKRINPYEMDRIENGYTSVSSAANIGVYNGNLKPDEVNFIWMGHNEDQPYKDWQIAHFRMLNDSFFLPYGVSVLHKARRAWRMLSMMEDSMLIYRLDKSVERRVFKIYVGAIDDADVPAYVQEIANNFKRTPVIDPETGQIDLRMGFKDVSSDYFIPVRTENAPSPIENLGSAQNPTSMDDIQYMQNKILAGLGVPKSFLNFQEAQGKGQNLSLLDIRFCRKVNKVQQYLLLELNKVASIHLYLLGFQDDMYNFTLSMNNPSAQIEALELEDITKRLQAAAAALTDPGIGMPIFSWHRTLKEVMKLTDAEIKDILNEIRLEKAVAAELATTPQVIKSTGIFDEVDNIYKDFNDGQTQAPQQQGGEDGMGGAPGGGGAIGGDMGGSLNMDSLGGPGEEPSGDIGGETGSVPMQQAPNADPAASLNEGNEIMKNIAKSFMEQYFDVLNDSEKKENNELEETVDYVGKTTSLSKTLNDNIDLLSNITNKMGSASKILEEEVNIIKEQSNNED